MPNTTPDFCVNCRHLKESGACKQYKACADWLKWFRKSWAEIRTAAELIKEKEKALERSEGK